MQTAFFWKAKPRHEPDKCLLLYFDSGDKWKQLKLCRRQREAENISNVAADTARSYRQRIGCGSWSWWRTWWRISWRVSLASIAVLEKLPRWKGCPYVVPNPKTQKPFTHLNDSWYTALRRAGITGCRLHDLRHTYASNMIGAGHSLVVLSRALGHSSIQQSAVYSHIGDAALIAGADAAADAIGKGWIGTEEKKSPA
jgi:hypothetical protein